jgi:hypothetical protein
LPQNIPIFVITRCRAFARGIRVTHFSFWAKLGRPHKAGDDGCLGGLD